MAYELVMNAADDRDVQPGVMILLNGQYPGHDGRFAPTAPQLATAIRMASEKRQQSERTQRLYLPRQPSPDDITPEERDRVRVKMDAFVAEVADRARTTEAVETKRRKELFERTNKRFAPDMSEASMRRRLGFTVGDADGENEDMGGMEEHAA